MPLNRKWLKRHMFPTQEELVDIRVQRERHRWWDEVRAEAKRKQAEEKRLKHQKIIEKYQGKIRGVQAAIQPWTINTSPQTEKTVTSHMEDLEKRMFGAKKKQGE